MSKKLKGKGVENLKDEDKKKKQETLDKMEKTRKQDDQYLRDQAQKQIQFGLGEIKKGQDVIAQAQKQINNITPKILRLEGYVRALQELLEPKKEEKKD